MILLQEKGNKLLISVKQKVSVSAWVKFKIEQRVKEDLKIYLKFFPFNKEHIVLFMLLPEV